jgi:hypothetical protein
MFAATSEGFPVPGGNQRPRLGLERYERPSHDGGASFVMVLTAALASASLQLIQRGLVLLLRLPGTLGHAWIPDSSSRGLGLRPRCDRCSLLSRPQRPAGDPVLTVAKTQVELLVHRRLGLPGRNLSRHCAPARLQPSEPRLEIGKHRHHWRAANVARTAVDLQADSAARSALTATATAWRRQCCNGKLVRVPVPHALTAPRAIRSRSTASEPTRRRRLVSISNCWVLLLLKGEIPAAVCTDIAVIRVASALHGRLPADSVAGSSPAQARLSAGTWGASSITSYSDVFIMLVSGLSLVVGAPHFQDIATSTATDTRMRSRTSPRRPRSSLA